MQFVRQTIIFQFSVYLYSKFLFYSIHVSLVLVVHLNSFENLVKLATKSLFKSEMKINWMKKKQQQRKTQSLQVLYELGRESQPQSQSYHRHRVTSTVLLHCHRFLKSFRLRWNCVKWIRNVHDQDGIYLCIHVATYIHCFLSE